MLKTDTKDDEFNQKIGKRDTFQKSTVVRDEKTLCLSLGSKNVWGLRGLNDSRQQNLGGL